MPCSVVSHYNLLWQVALRHYLHVLIEAGAAWGEEREADLYVPTAAVLATFSADEIANYETPRAIDMFGVQKVESVHKARLVSVNDVFALHFGQGPEFVSIDTEGMDFPILKTIDFESFRLPIICIETNGGHLNDEEALVTEYMQHRGYRVFASTGLNTIYTR
ncbi:MAG: FkbM family methyltransferase [Coriobacteriia bacterium]|nr:FkbM family methyltransferase [Coriobacteriia bacterium]